MWTERWLAGGARPLALDGRSPQVLSLKQPVSCLSKFRNPMTRKRNFVRSAITPVATVTQTANSASEDLVSANHNVSDEMPELFSEQALVADYQYTLRYYRVLKRQVGPWQASFLAQLRRQPTTEDATAQGGHEFAAMYHTFLEVRSRLLVELPLLKTRLEATVRAEAVGGAADQPHARARSAVNANSASSTSWGLMAGGGLAAAGHGSSGSSAHPRSPAASPQHPTPHHHQQQQVDSVATWLLADRYRRQRAVAAAVADPNAIAPLQLLHTYATQPSNLPCDTSGAAQLSVYQDAAGGGSGTVNAERLTVAAADWAAGIEPCIPHDESTSGCAAGVSLLRESGSGGSDGGHSSRSDVSKVWVPYQPVIQLTPLPYQPVGAAAATPITGATSTGATSNHALEQTTGLPLPADVGCGCRAGSGVEGGAGEHQHDLTAKTMSNSSRDGAAGWMTQAGTLLPLPLPPQAELCPPADLTSLPSAVPAMTSTSSSTCTGAPEQPLPGAITSAVTSAAGQHSMQGGQQQQYGALNWRLEADIHLAADSRAKNALLAALQYKRSSKPTMTVHAGTAASGLETMSGVCGGDGGSGMETRRQKDDKATSGGEEAHGLTAPVGVDVDVQRGDAGGAYAGRNRRSDALPEAFLVCP